ncbi:MAG: O-antigen ligase family protein [Reyranellaceae bacterium]
MFRWRIGVYALVVYTPFTGIVVAAFAPSPIGNLVRDILIIIPLYVAFALTRRQSDRMGTPFGFIVIVSVFAALIAASAAISHTSGSMVSILGAKVWLFYIPLAAVAAAYARDKSDILNLMRLFVVMGWIPCAVGLLMWMGAINNHYRESVELLHGDFARNATQGFVAFQVGESKIFRIPGTFQFAAQYSMFCIFMVLPVLMQLRLEISRNWRLFGYATLVLAVAAALTSGSRGMFLHLPFLLAVIGALRFGFGRGSNMLVLFGLMVFGAVVLSQFDQSALFDHVAELAVLNGRGIILGGMNYAIESGGPWGIGVGAGTVAARHLGDLPTMMRLGQVVAVENYYAKAWLELGFLGFVCIVAMFIYLIVAGIQICGRLRDPQLRDVGLVVVAMVVFMAYISSRGWALDQDPMAYYYWLMLGILFKLPQLDAALATQGGIAQSRHMPRPLRPTPSYVRR